MKLLDRRLQLLSPKHTIIENIAANFAAEIYEVGRAQGMQSKYPNARLYAKAYFEKYIPNAISVCLDILGRSDVSDMAKNEIYEAILERTNDPTLNSVMPNPVPALDMTKYFNNKILPVIINSSAAPELQPKPLKKDMH